MGASNHTYSTFPSAPSIGTGTPQLAVARHGAGLEAGVYPAFALAIDVAFPLVLLAFHYPFAQPVFILIQREIPVLRQPLFRRSIAEGAARIDELLWR